MNIMDIFSWAFLLLVLRLAIPIALAAVGGTFSERSGVINIGLEGMMLMGAFGGVHGSYLFGTPWMGVVLALIYGGMTGFLHAVLCIRFKANQIVSGVGINIIAAGFTPVMVNAIWNKSGMSGSVAQLNRITIPLLSKIPIIKNFFIEQSPFLYFTVLIVVFGWYIMSRTTYGLRLRSIGDHPVAAETAGINVNRYRYVCVILSGVLAGLGGSYLSIVQNDLFVNNMTAGRGYMALAANTFGGWNPLGSFGASLVFSFAQAIRFNISEINLPDQFIKMIPYVITLIVLIGVGKNTKAPEALGRIDDNE